MFMTGKVVLDRVGEDEGIVGLLSGTHTNYRDTWFISELLEIYNGERVWVAYTFHPEPVSFDLLRRTACLADGVVHARLEVSRGREPALTENRGLVGGHDLVRLFEEHLRRYAVLVIERHPINLEAYSAEEYDA